MATLIDRDFRARLRALGDQYAASVPGLMAAIEQALLRCEAKGLKAENLAALQKQLHTIAGSAGTFGFGALGQECRRLEQQARRMAAQPDAGAAGWPALTAQIRQLLRWAAVDPRADSYVAPND
ncbi:MAG TPA: Hpt domain-containing protein [Janthinobacterium sp.]|jgi:HPt (histidine-containing phosphotransfer) domain-containing protein|nr:Hpt domain-containing protein [Janthinobacterium sp.]